MGINKTLTALIALALCSANLKAQIKVHSGGTTSMGSTTAPTSSNMVEVTGGHFNLVTATYAYKLGGNKILWTNNVSSSIYVGVSAGLTSTGVGNSFVGNLAGSAASNSGTNNCFFGYSSGVANTTGDDNVFLGFQSGLANISGDKNVFIGRDAGAANTTASNNTFVGYQSGLANISGTSNVFMGYHAGQANTASENTFVGYESGNANVSGTYNTFMGNQSGYSNTASYNAFVGHRAGYSNTSGSANICIGYAAGNSNTTGTRNSFTGYQSGYACVSGNYNTGYGYRTCAGTTGTGNVAMGHDAGDDITSGSYNTFIGFSATSNAGTYSNCAAIGSNTVVTGSNKMFFGDANITHIQGQVNFSAYSDGRFKINVTENVKGLTFINKLRPVTYNMDTKALDDFLIQNMPDSLKTARQQTMNFGPATALIHSGFIAQEVETAAQQAGFVSSIVSAPANANDPYALSYAEIVVPLVKAVQELSNTIDSLKEVTALQSEQLTACCNSGERTGNGKATNSGKPVDLLNIKNNSSENTTGSVSAANAILYQNIPNPFNRETSISYFVPKDSKNASLIIFDMQGKLLKTINISVFEKGSVTISAQELNPGMYIYTLVVNNTEVASKRMIITE